MKEVKEIRGWNSKNQWHGYHELYDEAKNLWCRGNYKNDEEIGYVEYNVRHLSSIGDNGTIVDFYIR